MSKEIDVQCVPDLVRKAITEYLEVGYTVVPDFFSPDQVELAFKECNYHTLSRDVDLRDPATWENVKGQHDWKQGWAKWLFSTGAQVCSSKTSFIYYLQVFSNTHPFLYMFAAALNNTHELSATPYEHKIHLPFTGGAFYHNDLNWFKYYELVRDGVNVEAVQAPQTVVFLSDTVPDKCEFYIVPSMYKKEKWYPLVEV